VGAKTIGVSEGGGKSDSKAEVAASGASEAKEARSSKVI